jgi:hypothetical protein
MWIEVAAQDFRTLNFQFSKCTIVNVSEESVFQGSESRSRKAKEKKTFHAVLGIRIRTLCFWASRIRIL